MTPLVLRGELPFVPVAFTFGGDVLRVENMLLDTGSASTLLSADLAATIGIVPLPTDRLRTLRGVGGREVVFARHIERVEVDGHGVDGFEVDLDRTDEIASVDFRARLSSSVAGDQGRREQRSYAQAWRQPAAASAC